MILLPAIDIRGGACVRLRRGDFGTAEQVADDPCETAAAFRAAGAAWIHMVDLDGAKDARPRNSEIFCRVAAESGLCVELGGGIRSMETIEFYLERGIRRVILGSAAVRDPGLVRDAVRHFGARIAVGIDARDGMAATDGWLDASGISYLELAKRMEDAGVRTIIFTDIARDGMLSGVSGAQLEALRRAVDCDIIASGGVKSLEDIDLCLELGLAGVICGKSVYSGSLDLKAAIERAGVQQC